ncbi:MAG: ComEC/Rec2 family competence protein [Christensenellaceae bacterium]|nr:ComEC/Rec2 family competence protein [Christensenellaceae bacterium]
MDKTLPKLSNSKFTNLRPFFFAAIFFIAGIFAAALFFENKVYFFIVLVIILVAGVVLYMFEKKLPLLLFLVLVTGFGLYILNLSITQVPEISGDTALTGRVTDVTVGKHDYKYTVILDDVEYLATLTGDPKRKVAVFTDDLAAIGDTVEVTGYIAAFNYTPLSSFSMSNYASSVNYVIDAERCTVLASGNYKGYETVYIKIKAAFDDAMGEDVANIALSLIIGHKNSFDESKSSDIFATRLSSIFAVSGLHFAFIAMIIFYVCRLLRVNRRISLSITIIWLLLYGALTGFPMPLIRVLVVPIILLISTLTNRQTDPLTTWGFSMIILLLPNTFALFEIGFQIASLSMLGVICFGGFFKRLFGRLNNKILNMGTYTVSTFASANLFSGAATINAFTSFGFYFTLGSIAIIPFISFVYILLMGGVLLSLIAPVLSATLIPLKFLVEGVGSLSTQLTNMRFATFMSGEIWFFSLLYILTMFLISKFILLRMKYKLRILVSSIGLAILAIIIV